MDGESAYYMSTNRNKKSITINLRNDKGKEILHKLAEKCDVIIENFRPGVAGRLGADYETIRKINPRMVYCSISGFGQNGPYRDRVAFDIIIQAMGGLMGITGEPGRQPVRIGVALVDEIAGLYAAIAILSAIIARGEKGHGQQIDIALLDSSVSILTYMAWNYFTSGRDPERMGSGHPNIVPYQAFKTKGGKNIIIGVAAERMWKDFCEALNLPSLLENPKFKTNKDRIKNREELIGYLNECFEAQDRDELLEKLNKSGVPCAPVYTMSEIFRDPQILSREMLIEEDHPTLGRIKDIGMPIKFSETPGEVRLPPPLLGQHTDEILEKMLGYGKGEVKQLRGDGVI